MQGKVVAITGASRGIGEAAARAFADAGAKVVLLARSARRIEDLAQQIGDNALAVPCDVADAAQVFAALAAAESRFGGLDVLINNAGIIEPVAFMAEAAPDDWGRIIDVNLKGVFYGMRAAIPLLRKRGGGTIITVSSGAAHNPLEGWSAYCASKAGAAMLTRAAHLEEATNGLRIMGLSPGTVATEMQVAIKASGINRVSKLEVSDHFPPEWPAKALLWMCSPAANAHCGEELSMRDPALQRAAGLIA